MPSRNSASDRQRRREGAAARTAATETAKTTAMSGAELKAYNQQLAQEKASRAEGGGHAHPELTEAGLQRATHVDQYRWTHGKLERIPDVEPCRIALGLCLDCLSMSTEIGEREVNLQLHRAKLDMVEIRNHKAQKQGITNNGKRAFRRQAAI